MNKTIQILVTMAPIILSSAAAYAQDSLAALPISDKERAVLFPSASDIEQGEALAESSCISCHGLDGISADENLPHLAGQRTLYLYREMLAYQKGLRNDESMRGAVQFLSDDALLKVSAYYANSAGPRGESAPDVPAQDAAGDDPLEAGKVATAGCAGCHGAIGNSSMPGMPNLTAQHPDYFAAAMKAYQSGSRPDATMKTLVASLDDDTIESMAIYYALQEPQQTAGRGTGNAQAGSSLAEPCAGCHGADGNTTAADTPTLAGQDAAYLTKALKAYQNGQRDHALMVSAMEGLSEADIDALSAFYAAQEPTARSIGKPLSTAEWISRCSRCHGVDGNSFDPRYPSLAGQHAKYLARVLNDYVSGKRPNGAMHAMSSSLKPAQIERIAAHYASKDAKSVVYVELPCNGEDEE